MRVFASSQGGGLADSFLHAGYISAHPGETTDLIASGDAAAGVAGPLFWEFWGPLLWIPLAMLVAGLAGAGLGVLWRRHGRGSLSIWAGRVTSVVALILITLGGLYATLGLTLRGAAPEAQGTAGAETPELVDPAEDVPTAARTGPG